MGRVMMTLVAGGAAALASPAIAQVDPVKLGKLVAIIESGDAEAFAAQDKDIDYLPTVPSVVIPAETALALFAGCKARSLDTVDNSYGMSMLRFECPGRSPPEKCKTGDLDLMVQDRTFGVNIGVAEVDIGPRENSECTFLAPPPPPPSRGKN